MGDEGIYLTFLKEQFHDIIDVQLGMTGFDGGGWFRIASREAPTSLTQRNN